MQEQKVAVVTGSSTGIGFETSLTLARSGFYTYATVRKPNEGSKQITNVAKNENLPLRVIQLDVDNDISVIDTTINAIVRERGRIDVVVNNAGFALGGALEETSIEEMRKQMETNFFGAVKVMKSVIPIMREHTGGKIVNITSMGGRISIPFSAFYHGSKFALEGLSESIQYELEPFGIKIILIEPGAVGSNFWKNIRIAEDASSSSDSPYGLLASSMSKAFEKMEENAIHPYEVAKTVLAAVTSDNPQRYVVGNDVTATMEASKNMSDGEFGDLIKKQFNL